MRDALNNFTKAPDKEKFQISDADLVNDPEWMQSVLLAKSILDIFEKNNNIYSSQLRTNWLLFDLKDIARG